MINKDITLMRIVEQSIDFRRALASYLDKNGFKPLWPFNWFEPRVEVENSKLTSVYVSGLIKYGPCIYGAEAGIWYGRPGYSVSIACPKTP